MDRNPLDTVCALLAHAMGIEPPRQAAVPLTEYIDRVLAGERADRVLMYNPDAIGQWTYEKNGTTYYATHGEDIPQDMNILHRYKRYPASK